MTIVKDFSSDTTTFPDLPVHLWKEIFAFIGSSIRQQRLAMSMFGKATWSLIPELEASMKSLVISDEADANALLLHDKTVLLQPKGPRHELTVLMFEERRLPDVFRRLTNLQHLDLKSYANEGFFEFLDCHAPLPNLRSLSMVGSLGVTDQGLKRIVNGGEPRRQNFESLIITFCRNTSFAATIFIRENLPNLKLIRRQPAWLDGQFYTPFAPEGAPDEIHTYWPDGTFTFSRNTESTGFVRDLFPWDSDEDFLGDKLQYNNPLFPAGWPDWFRLAYRPGVSLLRIDDVMDSSSDTDSPPTRCVLVSQRMRGLKPPNARAVTDSAKHTLLPGESKQYTEDGDVIPDDAPADVFDKSIMISKMKVHPLPVENGSSLLPPARLVEECKITCDAMAGFGDRFLDEKEIHLQLLLTAR